MLTGGNYVLGVGLGYREGEFTAFGMSLKERAPRLEESIALMRRLWSGEKVTHKGRFYEVNDHAIGLKPVREGGPPIWFAGTAEAAIKRAARLGDAWMIVPSTHAGRAGAADAGISRGAGRRVHRLLPDGARMLRRRQPQDRAGRVPRRAAIQIRRLRVVGPVGPRRHPAFEELARDRFIIGDSVFVKEEIARYREALGVDHFMMRCHWPGLEFDKALASIRRLGEIFA